MHCLAIDVVCVWQFMCKIFCNLLQFSAAVILHPKAKGRQFPSLITHMQCVQVLKLTMTGMWLDSVMHWCKAISLLNKYSQFFVAAEWMNFYLHFQTLLTLPGALMETTAMALDPMESYHAGQSISQCWGAYCHWDLKWHKTHKTEKWGTFAKYRFQMGGFHNFFWCWQPIAHNFSLTQLHLITNMYHGNVQHRTTKGNIMENNTFIWINRKPPAMFIQVFI